MTRAVITYSLVCVFFWFGALVSPLHWTAKVIPSDIHHVYNSAFYSCLLLIGLLLSVPKEHRVWRLTVLGAAIGLVSSMLSILVVVQLGPNSLGSITKSSGGSFPWILDFTIFCAVVLLGPLWGVGVALVTLLGLRLQASKRI